MRSSSDANLTGDRSTSTGVVAAYIEGWRRAIAAPGVVLVAWLITTLVALPLAAMVHEDIETHLGASAIAEHVLDGWDQDWTGEFGHQARGVSTTLTREVLGGVGIIATLSRVFDAEPPPVPLRGAIGLNLVLWVFLSGGILDRLARGRPVGTAGFVALCGRYFLRLARLAAIGALAYWLLFRLVHPLLFDTLFDRWTRDLDSESQGLLLRGGLYVVFALLLALVSLVIDFTRVRLVIEDRYSVFASLGAALRFIRRRFWRCGGLYALNIGGQALLALLWLYTAPGADAPDWAALLIAQIYLLVRLWARLAFLGSEAAFFQGELAHAAYTAAPLPQWPDSPAVEAIRNLRRD